MHDITKHAITHGRTSSEPRTVVINAIVQFNQRQFAIVTIIFVVMMVDH